MSTSSVSAYGVAKYVAAWLVIWVATAAAAEGVFRARGERPSADLEGLYAQLGDSNYRLRPSVDTGATWSTGRFSVHTDELGLRCDVRRKMAARRGDRIDLLFLGDSQGFGNGVNFEDTIAGTVAGLAAESGYVIRNACVGGQTPLNQLEVAKLLLEQHELRIANYLYLFTPSAIANCDGFTRAAVGTDGRLYTKETTRLTIARTWLKTHSVVYSRVRDAVRAVGVGVAADEQTPFVFGLYRAGAQESVNQKKCTALLRRFKDFAAEQGARFHVVYVPFTLEMDFTEVRRGGDQRGLSLDPEAPFRVLTAAAAEANLPVHDLRPVLQGLHARGEPLSLLPDFHYTGALSRASGVSIWNRMASEIAGKDDRATQQ